MARLFDDGSNQYLELDSPPVTTYPFTMACWFYSDDTTVSQCLISLPDKDAVQEFFALEAAGAVAGDPIRFASISATTGGADLADTTSGYSADTWHHACAVAASTTDRAVFIDGGNKGTNTQPNDPAGVDRISVGRHGDNSPDNYFSGRIAEAAVWNVALTDAEVAVLSVGVSPLRIRPANLVAYWPLIRDEDQDRVGGYHLTVYNSPTVATHPPKVKPWWLLPVVLRPPVAALPNLSIAVTATDPDYLIKGIKVAG